MGLSCECGDYRDSDWWYFPPDDFTLLQTKRGRRCASCGSKIKVADIVLKFPIYRAPTEFEIETIGICEGDDVPKAPKYLCEKCGDIYSSLEESGFCVSPCESMTELLHDYHENYGRKDV